MSIPAVADHGHMVMSLHMWNAPRVDCQSASVGTSMEVNQVPNVDNTIQSNSEADAQPLNGGQWVALPNITIAFMPDKLAMTGQMITG